MEVNPSQIESQDETVGHKKAWPQHRLQKYLEKIGPSSQLCNSESLWNH